MLSMLPHNYSSKKEVWPIAALCLSYLIFQLICIPSPALSMDEFWFAHHINEYTHKLPYRDFLPYKTVLGYYLLSIPMFIFHGVLQPVYYIKDEIAFINTFFLSIISLWLTRFFKPKMVFYAVLFILASHLFLIYSVDLRTDMLSGWLALISILLILSNRFAWAGIILAIAFMVSQKAIWFYIATHFAFACYWLIISRRYEVIRQMLIFDLAAFFTLSIYIIFWASQSHLSTVLSSVFYEGYLQSKITWFSSIYYSCWSVILRNGPLLVFFTPLTWITLFVRATNDTAEYSRRLFIIAYATIVMFLIVANQQAFPYGMVLAIPAYFLLYCEFFSWLNTIFQQVRSLKPFNQRKVFWFISLYTICLVALLILMRLSFVYYLVIYIPICLCLFLITPKFTAPFKDIFKNSLFTILIFIGVLYPMIRLGVIIYTVNGNYQRAMITASNELLKEGGGFFAGTPLIYNRDQAIPGLKNLIGPAIEYLSNPSPKLLPIMLTSLYLEPRTTAEVLHDLKVTPIKLYVNNYRIVSLPYPIKIFLSSEFAHYWGSIYIYAPRISANQQQVLLKFSGYYQVIAEQNAQIYLDHKKIFSNELLFLKNGIHFSKAENFYRLKYFPMNKLELNKQYRKDSWYSMVKPIVT